MRPLVAGADEMARLGGVFAQTEERASQGVPGSWSGQVAELAVAQHQVLVGQLQGRVQVVAQVQRVLAEAIDEVLVVQRAVGQAESFAVANGVLIGADGTVRDVQGVPALVSVELAGSYAVQREQVLLKAPGSVAEAVRLAQALDEWLRGRLRLALAEWEGLQPRLVLQSLLCAAL